MIIIAVADISGVKFAILCGFGIIFFDRFGDGLVSGLRRGAGRYSFAVNVAQLLRGRLLAIRLVRSSLGLGIRLNNLKPKIDFEQQNFLASSSL